MALAKEIEKDGDLGHFFKKVFSIYHAHVPNPTQGKAILGLISGSFFRHREGPSKCSSCLWPVMHGYLFGLNGWLPLMPVKQGHALPYIY